MFIAKRLIDRVVDVVRVNERIMYVKLMIGKQRVNSAFVMLHKWVSVLKRRMTSGTALKLCSLEFLSKKKSIFNGSDINGHVEEIQTEMVVSMVVWDLVQ